jgi:hypothetical protein
MYYAVKDDLEEKESLDDAICILHALEVTEAPLFGCSEQEQFPLRE